MLCWQSPYGQGYGFSSSHVRMWELDHNEGWVTKNWCFWTAVLERLLRVPWTARRSNQSNLKEISPEYSLERLCWSWNPSTLATWCEELPHLNRPWCWERLKAGEGDNRIQDGWMASLTRWTWVWASSRRWWWTGKPGMLQSWGCKELGMTERLNNNCTEKLPDITKRRYVTEEIILKMDPLEMTPGKSETNSPAKHYQTQKLKSKN